MAKRTYNRLAQYRSGKMFYKCFLYNTCNIFTNSSGGSKTRGWLSTWRNVFWPPQATSFGARPVAAGRRGQSAAGAAAKGGGLFATMWRPSGPTLSLHRSSSAGVSRTGEFLPEISAGGGQVAQAAHGRPGRWQQWVFPHCLEGRHAAGFLPGQGGGVPRHASGATSGGCPPGLHGGRLGDTSWCIPAAPGFLLFSLAAAQTKYCIRLLIEKCVPVIFRYDIFAMRLKAIL